VFHQPAESLVNILLRRRKNDDVVAHYLLSLELILLPHLLKKFPRGNAFTLL
jgi:hypothetical protein